MKLRESALFLLFTLCVAGALLYFLQEAVGNNYFRSSSAGIVVDYDTYWQQLTVHQDAYRDSFAISLLATTACYVLLLFNLSIYYPFLRRDDATGSPGPFWFLVFLGSLVPGFLLVILYVSKVIEWLFVLFPTLQMGGVYVWQWVMGLIVVLAIARDMLYTKRGVNSSGHPPQ